MNCGNHLYSLGFAKKALLPWCARGAGAVQTLGISGAPLLLQGPLLVLQLSHQHGKLNVGAPGRLVGQVTKKDSDRISNSQPSDSM